MGLKKLIARIKCSLKSSCCKAEVQVNVDTDKAQMKPSLSNSVFDKKDYDKFYKDDSD